MRSGSGSLSGQETPVGPVSPYLKRCVAAYAPGRHQLALDLPCGRGRNAIWLARQGLEVVAADLDRGAMAALRAAVAGAEEGERIRCLALSARARLPFRDEVFDLVTVIHFIGDDLLDEMARVLKRGGVLIFETYAGHGDNWRALPAPGAIAAQLAGRFEMLDYIERLVGPEGRKAAVVMATARKV